MTVGNPGNPADTRDSSQGGTPGCGSVAFTYQIGTYDVTLAQYTAFLNAVAKIDTYGLYDPGMGTDFSTYFDRKLRSRWSAVSPPQLREAARSMARSPAALLHAGKSATRDKCFRFR